MRIAVVTSLCKIVYLVIHEILVCNAVREQMVDQPFRRTEYWWVIFKR